MSLIVGSCSDLDVNASDVCDFYRKNWARPIALSFEDFYRWQFIKNSKNNGVDECCVAMDGNEIIGVMGLNARSFFLNGKELSGAELTTWVVSEKHRNRGIGPRMISYLKREYDVMVGMGISLAALPIYLRSDFRYIKAILRYVHPINWKKLSRLIECSHFAKKYNRDQFSSREYSIYETKEDVVNDIYSKFCNTHNSFSRAWSDVSWRYDEHPYYKYHHFIVNGDCFVCMRIDRDIDGFVMAHCIDIFGDSISFPSAISAAIDYAVANGADAIDFFSTSGVLCAALNELGLFSTLDYDFFKFPHLFHPVEIRNPATTSLILWARNDMVDLLDISRLHITKQDADFDRPTAQVINK